MKIPTLVVKIIWMYLFWQIKRQIEKKNHEKGNKTTVDPRTMWRLGMPTPAPQNS